MEKKNYICPECNKQCDDIFDFGKHIAFHTKKINEEENSKREEERRKQVQQLIANNKILIKHLEENIAAIKKIMPNFRAEFNYSDNYNKSNSDCDCSSKNCSCSEKKTSKTLENLLTDYFNIFYN